MQRPFFLIVEDDLILAKGMDRMVSRYFIESQRDIDVIVVNSGEDAVDRVMERIKIRPEAEWGLLSDYDMPDMSGSELINRLDALLGDRLVWRMIVTGILDEDRRRELEAKQTFIEEKPIDKKDLESYLYMFLTTLS
jgi:CheY-like chemotaxis protein